MSVITIISRKIVGFFLGIISTVQKLMCFLHIVRRRKNSGSILPLVSNHSDGLAQGEIQTSLPSNDFELQSWDSWGQEPSGFAQSVPASTDKYVQNHHGNNVSGHHRNKPVSESEGDPDVDYFTDMQPEIKRTAKILVRKKEERPHPIGLSSRLAMAGEALPMIQQGELGQWDESENAWSSEALEDLSWEADSALKEKKRQERELRQMEQQQKKLSRERDRIVRPVGGRLTAVKLS